MKFSFKQYVADNTHTFNELAVIEKTLTVTETTVECKVGKCKPTSYPMPTTAIEAQWLLYFLGFTDKPSGVSVRSSPITKSEAEVLVSAYFVGLRNTIIAATYLAKATMGIYPMRNKAKQDYNRIIAFLTGFYKDMIPSDMKPENRKLLEELNADYAALLMQEAVFMANIASDDVQEYIDDVTNRQDEYITKRRNEL